MFTFASYNLLGSESKISTKDVIKIDRYDWLQYEFVTTNSVSALNKMNTEFSQVTKFLIEDVLSLGKVDDNHINRRMKLYLSDSTLMKLMQDALRDFEDLTPIEKQLNLGFSNLKKEFPDIVIPKVYAQFSALNQSVVIGDSLLGFSIDKYLGVDYPLYKEFYYDYQTRTMRKDRVASDCLAFYLQGQYPISEDFSSNLLDLILYKGKVYWIVSNILEYDSFDKGLGYTEKESKWCHDNKERLLETIINRDKLFVDDKLRANDFINHDSLRILFGNNTPPALSVWVGTELVDRYMKQNENISLSELINSTDYKKILLNINHSI